MNPKIIRVIMTYKVEINYETSDIGNSIHKVTSQNYCKTVDNRERSAHKKTDVENFKEWMQASKNAMHT